VTATADEPEPGPGAGRGPSPEPGPGSASSAIVPTSRVLPASGTAKSIQLIVTTAAGGANDLVARCERLSESLKQPVIIENQPTGQG
jgi:tripartite-type tricarboxylate transporter receptor subunit TctC